MKFGLIGKSLKHSFSKNYFHNKFNQLQLSHSYDLFELNQISDVKFLLENDEVFGLNVTVPYKTEILSYVDVQSKEVQEIGAANVLCKQNGQWHAYNTDVIGFENSFLGFVNEIKEQRAIVIGNGGAAKAVIYVLKKLKIPFVTIARPPQNSNEIPLHDFALYGKTYKIWINTTPVGMYPDVDATLPIDYSCISSEHYLYDLIYNPELTTFLNEGRKYGAKIKNGLEMLYLQAEATWGIWSTALGKS
jgi:shikimate dehydrogenase